MRSNSFKTCCLLVVDQILAFCLVAPLVVLYWRGTWQLWDTYVYPDDRTTSGWVCFGLGNLGLATLAFLKVPLSKLTTNLNKCSIKWILGYHAYIYVAGLCSVAHWRGIWLVLDAYTGITVTSNTATLVIGLGVLYLLRASKNCWAPPVACVIDTDPAVFEFNTRFNTKPRDVENYILDTLLTTFLIHNLVVFFWRGSWGLLDLLLYPDDVAKSAYVSLAVAAVLFSILTPVQIVLLNLQKSLRSKPFLLAVLVDDLVFTLACFSAVVHWRGVWYVCNVHLLVENPVGSNWVSHGVGAVGGALFLCSASYIVKSFHPDGGSLQQEHASPVGILPNHYIRYFLRNRKMSKQRASEGEEFGGECRANNNVLGQETTSDAKGVWL